MATTDLTYGPVSWERMSNGIENVKDRLRRTVAALQAAGVRYAVIGGNAVAAWVSRVDESVVRNTRDVDILLDRADFARAITAMEAAGFIHKSASILGGAGRIEMFLDGPRAKARDAVHVIFAGERVNPESVLPSPGVDEIDPATDELRLLDFGALVRMELTSFSRVAKVHLRDLMETGQLDESWLARVPEEVRPRLAELLADPHG